MTKYRCIYDPTWDWYIIQKKILCFWKGVNGTQVLDSAHHPNPKDDSWKRLEKILEGKRNAEIREY